MYFRRWVSRCSMRIICRIITRLGEQITPTDDKAAIPAWLQAVNLTTPALHNASGGSLSHRGHGTCSAITGDCHVIDSRLCAAWGSARSCQITSSESRSTHLQLAAAWASSGVWTPLLKTASLRLGAHTAPHIWMSDNVTQPSVWIDSNDYFQVVWQAKDELAEVHLVTVRGGYYCGL